MTEYKTGDEVTVRGWVIKDSIDDPKCVDVGFNSLVAGLRIHYSEIATHTPKPYEPKVGDMVTWGDRIFGYKLVFIGTDYVAVDQQGEPCIVLKTDIKPRLSD